MLENIIQCFLCGKWDVLC